MTRPAGVFRPEEVRLGARVLRTGTGGWVGVWIVTGYPAEVYPGWLDGLLSYPGRLDVSLHLHPVDPLTASDGLRKRLARLESRRRHGAEHERLPDPLVEAATEDAHELASRVARGEASLCRVGLYLAVHAPTREHLADEIAAVRALTGSLLIDTRPASYRQWEGWLSCLPVGLDPLATHRIMDSGAAGAMFPFSSPDLPTDPATPAAPHPGVLYGANHSGGLVFYDRFTPENDNHNAVVLGRSGSGKSYLVKLELLRSLYRGIEGLVIDPEDEYTRLTVAVGGRVVRLGSGVGLNPFTLPIHEPRGEPSRGPGRVRGGGRGGRYAAADAVDARVSFLVAFCSMLLGGSPDPTDTAVLEQALCATYHHAGITQDDPHSWARPAPAFARLHRSLCEHPDPAAAVWATRLRPYTHGSHAHLFTDPAQVPGEGLFSGHLTSFSLRRVPDELAPAMTMLVLDLIWRRVSDTAAPRPRLVVVDEAWMLMRHPAAAAWLARMAKSARKRWAGLTFVSQDVADVLDSELGRNIVIANSPTVILLRQAPQTITALARACGLSGGEASWLMRAARGEALLTVGGSRRVALRAIASPGEDELVRTDPAFLAALPAAAGDDIVRVDRPHRRRG